MFASRMLQWAAPDLNCKLQIAVGGAGPELQAADHSGRRRTSTGSSRAEWAAPGLNRGTPQRRSGQRRTAAIRKKMPENIPKKMSIEIEMSEKYVKRMSEEEMSIQMSKNMSEKNVRRYVKKNVRKK